MTDIEKGARVKAYYKGSAFVGTATEVSETGNYVDVRFAPGVSMILPLQDVHLLKEERTEDDD